MTTEPVFLNIIETVVIPALRLLVLTLKIIFAVQIIREIYADRRPR